MQIGYGLYTDLRLSTGRLCSTPYRDLLRLVVRCFVGARVAPCRLWTVPLNIAWLGILVWVRTWVFLLSLSLMLMFVGTPTLVWRCYAVRTLSQAVTSND